MILKQIPEDFIVDEIPLKKIVNTGFYSIFKLRKYNYDTEKAVQTIVNALHIKRKDVGIAGNKDKKAVTTQFISIYRIKPKKVLSLDLKDITLKHVGFSKSPISLGDLEGNKFIITVRKLKDYEIVKKSFIPNYYDTQRFSSNNVDIGKAIIKKDFKKACNTLISVDSTKGPIIEHWLNNNPNDYVNALKQIPIKILQLYCHSFQSHLWNQTLKKCLENDFEVDKIPLVGFFTEVDNKKVKDLLEVIMEKESVTYRDFILREFPQISLEGSERSAYTEVKNLKIETRDDELNKGFEKAIITFELQKGSYATMVVKYLIRNGFTGI